MMPRSSSTRCVICFQTLKPQHPSLAVPVPAASPGSASSIDSEKSLEKELLVMFLIKKFLKCSLISEDEGFQEFLLVNHGNPSEWVQFCSACSETVQEARQLHMALLEMEGKLDTLRNLVQFKVAKSFDEFTEEIQKESMQDPKENETFCNIRQSIFSIHQQSTFSAIPSQRFHEVDIKEERSSDMEDECPEEISPFPSFEEHILIPEFQNLKTDHKDVFDECEKSGPVSKKRRTSKPLYKYKAEDCADSDSNADTEDDNKDKSDSNSKVLSSQKKYTRKGPMKSSVESRTCPVCDLIYDKPSSMIRHVRSHHKDYNPTPCIVKSSTEDLENIHLGEEGSNLTSTETDIASIDQTSFKIKLKGVASTKRRSRPSYKYESIGSDEDSEDDNKVQKSKNNSDSNYSHSEDDIGSDHSENIDVSDTSDDCGKVTKSRNQSKQKKRPRRTSTKVTSTKTKTCQICNKVFKHQYVMQLHIKCAHEKTTRYTCEICGKTFSWRSGLSLHIKKTHDEGWVAVKPFQCSHESCNKSFRYRGDLLRHEKIHVPIKEFLCNICGATFLESRSLVRHEKIHSGVKEFSCAKCPETVWFRHKSNLLRHDIYLHQKDAPKKFVCEKCGKSFKTNTHLVQHLQSKSHGGVGFKKPKSYPTKATKKTRPIDNIQLNIPLQDPHANNQQLHHESIAVNQL